MPPKKHKQEPESIAIQSIKEARVPESLAGYTRMYLHEYTTPWGENRERIVHGDICSDIKDLPTFMEYSTSDHKYLGVSMITMVPVLNSKNQPLTMPIYEY